MKRKNMLQQTAAGVLLGGLALLGACASPGTPSGGPRDEDAPRFERSNPAPGSVDVRPDRIDIWFDEIVNVKDAFNKVVVSPTGTQVPKVSSLGRRVRVDFQDTLMANTTYSIDFGNAIEDNNEGNKLQNFTYTFSTGPQLDSLQISGMVLNAQTLEPGQGMMVGVYTALDDTTFQRKRLERVARTDDRGRFVIRGLNEGPYYLFALNDLNHDMRWDNPEEEMAFYGEPIVPTAVPGETTDTIWDLHTGHVDSVYTRVRTTFLPNDVLLNSFVTDRKPQYLVNNERIDSTRISLVFNTRAERLPKISMIGAPYVDGDDWYRLQRNQTNDTLTYWIKPGAVLHTDTLHLAIEYLRGENEVANDTLRLVTKRPRPVKQKENKKKKEEETSPEDEMRFLDMKMLTSSTHEYYSPLMIEFGAPLDSLRGDAFSLEIKEDTVWKALPQPVPIPVDSLSLRQYKIEHNWDFGREYRLSIDSIAAIDMYGLFNKPLEHTFKVKAEEEYSNLRFNISGIPDTIPAFVELLNSSGTPVKTAFVEKNAAIFRYLAAGTYYARLIEDLNGNGRYDTGDYEKGLQPEYAFYYPKAVKLKANWDLDQTWNVAETPLDRQKPEAIKKNKPERTKADQFKKNETEEDDDEQFDVSRNPFDPNSNKRKRQTGVRY